MKLWAEEAASVKVLRLDQFMFCQSRKLYGYSRVSDGEMDRRRRGGYRSQTHSVLEAEGTNVGFFPELGAGRQGPVSLPGPRRCGSAAPWWRVWGPRGLS